MLYGASTRWSAHPHVGILPFLVILDLRHVDIAGLVVLVLHPEPVPDKQGLHLLPLSTVSQSSGVISASARSVAASTGGQEGARQTLAVCPARLAATTPFSVVTVGGAGCASREHGLADSGVAVNEDVG